MVEIKKVVLVGAGGAVGPAILAELVSAGFSVTVFTRAGSKTSLPSSVKIAEVDFDSESALTSALKGQDAVVSTLGAMAMAAQTNVINAAIAAGVKRFIPSEFGSDTTNPKARALPVYRDKVAAEDFLAKKASEGAITYTLVFNGALFDWGMMIPFILNLGGKSAELYDGGDRPFSTSKTTTVGKAIAGILSHYEETKNRPVYIQDAIVTQNKLVALGEKLTGSKFDTKIVKTAELESAAYVELGKESPDPNLWFSFIKRAVWAEGYGGDFKKTDNALLGLKSMSESEIEGLVASFCPK
ncbi:hypothetical protein MMC27_002048 [Xylographa pallens]|nr:hypothetical protein [Xylographa pallens]